jgi:hyperosmotically inducible protein
MNTRYRSCIAPLLAIALCAACGRSNVAISAKITAKMALDTTLKEYPIAVTTNDGVVTLTGNIDSAEAKARALALAKETAGVIEVRDMIEVRRPDGSGEAPEPGRTVGVTIDDAVTTVRVKSLLRDDPGVKAGRIDVDTRDGVVFLTGSVGSETERERHMVGTSFT